MLSPFLMKHWNEATFVGRNRSFIRSTGVIADSPTAFGDCSFLSAANGNAQVFALAQAAQRHCGCLIPGGAQGQVGWGPAQTELWQGKDWNRMGFKVSFNPSTLWFYASVTWSGSRGTWWLHVRTAPVCVYPIFAQEASKCLTAF